MTRCVMAIALLALAACGKSQSMGTGGGSGGGGSGTSSATITGTVKGFTFTPLSSTAELDSSTGTLTYGNVRISTAADYCALKRNGCTVDAVNMMEIDLQKNHAGSSLALTTGSYTAYPDGTVPDDTLIAFVTVSHVHHGTNEPPVAGNDSLPFEANSGTVTLTALGPQRVTGSFDLMFGSQNDHVTGSFDVPACSVDYETWVGDGSGICDAGP